MVRPIHGAHLRCAKASPRLSKFVPDEFVIRPSMALTPSGRLRRADRLSCRSVEPGFSSSPRHPRETKLPPQGWQLCFWRRGRDSNPRCAINARLISSQVQSTTLPPLRFLRGWRATRQGRDYTGRRVRSASAAAGKSLRNGLLAGRRTPRSRGQRIGSARIAAIAAAASSPRSVRPLRRPRDRRAGLRAGGCCPAGH